ncbi:MAG: DUF3891 family protein [Phycisphaerae bacterium]|jgi:hypothetical protein
MILHPCRDGWIAIRQSAHALMAFQLADHWGNRTTPRPAPRAEVLAAVLLHDSGWDGREEIPRLTPAGEPVAFDSLPEGEHEEVWTACVERAATRGRYAAYLVSHHVSHLAQSYASAPCPEFLAREEARRAALVAALAEQPRYADLFRTEGDRRNRAIVRLTDALAVLLSLGVEGRRVLPGLPQRQGDVDLELRHLGGRSYRLRPWPLAGRRLTVYAEGVVLPRRTWASEDDLRQCWHSAPVALLSWTLLSPGTPVEDVGPEAEEGERETS